MGTRYLFLLRIILALSDIILINLCLFISFQFSSLLNGEVQEFYRQNIIICNLIWLISTSIFRLYTTDTIHSLVLIYRATWKSIALHSFLFLTFIFFTGSASFPREFLAIFYTMFTVGFMLSRFTGTAIQDNLHKHFDIRKAVAVLGMNPGGLKLAAYLEEQSSLNFTGFLGDEGFYIDPQGKLIPAASEQLRKAAHAGVKEVYVSLDATRMEDIPQLIREGERHCVRLKFVPDLSGGQAAFRIEHMGGFPVLCARKEPLEDIQNRFKKRFLDVAISLSVMVFIFSWLYPILAIIIKWQSNGPVLFKQLRSGRDNKPFYCYKFRSMCLNADSNSKQATRNDDRITPIGKFMRKTSLDEFPQFINVLLGDMSVIGPRPHMLSHTEQYRALIDKYMVRQFLKPGISGWAQVNGYRGETKETAAMEKRVEHDIWYMENWSSMLDVRVLFMTVINAIKGEENAY
ncbi:MAG: undecaprenyl-phosphate glucose phosphotransferase [Sphingobacteriaceae bacterium]|nr:undecaprenyl-phosphate glucose phosphotransferase [Sphingobacteriaceae bacterium]